MVVGVVGHGVGVSHHGDRGRRLAVPASDDLVEHLLGAVGQGGRVDVEGDVTGQRGHGRLAVRGVGDRTVRAARSRHRSDNAVHGLSHPGVAGARAAGLLDDRRRIGCGTLGRSRHRAARQRRHR